MSYAVKYLPTRLKVTLRIVGLPASDPVILVKPAGATHSSELLVDMVSCRYDKPINLYHFYNSYTKGKSVFHGAGTSADVLDLLYVEGYDEPLGTLLHTMDGRAIERLAQPWAKDLDKLMKLFPTSTCVTVRYKGASKPGQFHPNGQFSYIGGNLDTIGLSPSAFVEATAGRDFDNPFDHIFVQIDKGLDQSLSVYLQEDQKMKDAAASLMKLVDAEPTVTVVTAKKIPTPSPTVSQKQRDNEKEDLKRLLDSPMTVRVCGSIDGCYGAICATLEVDGTFTREDPETEVTFTGLHSLELIWHFNYTPAMGRAVIPIDPETSLTHIYFLDDYEKSLAGYVEEFYEDMPPLIPIAAIEPTPSPSSRGGIHAATQVTQSIQSPQSLLAVAKARTQELQAELDLWQKIVAQKAINKQLEQELERIKASVV